MVKCDHQKIINTSMNSNRTVNIRYIKKQTNIKNIKSALSGTTNEHVKSSFLDVYVCVCEIIVNLTIYNVFNKRVSTSSYTNNSVFIVLLGLREGNV